MKFSHCFSVRIYCFSFIQQSLSQKDVTLQTTCYIEKTLCSLF